MSGQNLRIVKLLSVCAVGLMFGLASSAAAQTVSGTVQGTVTDSSGGVLPGVSITVRNTETGQVRDVTTNEVGFFSLPFLPLGPYQITAALSGFGTVVREKTDVTLNETRVVDFQLKPATVSETITVTAESPRINTTNAEVKGSLQAEQILDKPTSNPGSFLSLAEIFTGFQENPTSGQNNPTASSGSSINFSGTGTRGATFQINGVNNDDSSENQNRQGAALSTIKEFQVITNSYSAEFGRGYGAVVLVQTKSGTNRIHGDVYEYHQNSELNEKTFFGRNLPKAVNRRNQFGGTAGFPIRENVFFGFVSFDHLENTGQNPPSTRDLPLPSELAAPRLTRGNDTPANRAFIESVLARFPSTLVPNDPRSPRTAVFQVNRDWPDREYSLRLDYQRGGRNHAFARYQYTRQRRINEELIVGETTGQNNRQQNVGITWTHVFSSSTIGEFRYGLGLRDTNVGIKSGNNTPIIRFNQLPTNNSPIIGNAGNFPITRDQMDNQFVYNLNTIFRRTHSFKVGTDIRRVQLDDLADNFSRGFWTFANTCGGTSYGSSYLALLDGCVQSFQTAWGPFFLENRIPEYNVYAEDNWRVRPNLTLNLGLRYEYVAVPHDVENRIDYGFGDDEDNIEPRLGFAYSPTWKDGWLGWLSGGPGRASIRGGFGIYHGRLFQSIFSQGGAGIRFNPPNSLSRTFTTMPGILNVSDPTLDFVFVPGPQTVRHMITIADASLEMPAKREWSLTLERQVPFNSTVRLTYTGNHGVGFLRYTQDNLPVSPLDGGIVVVDHPNNAPAAGLPDLRGVRIDRIAADFLCAGTGLPGITVTAACPNPVPIANNEVSFRVPRTNERRPNPLHTTNLIVSNGSESWYHGLQTEWDKRLSRGLQFKLAYTWSKAIDTTSEATFVGAGDSNQQGPIARFARGFSRFHTPHRLTVFASYQVPFLKDREDLVGLLLGGWTVAPVLKLASGTPFTVIDGSARDLNFDGFAERPVLLDSSILRRSIDDPATSEQQLPRSAFRSGLPSDFGVGLVGRNAFFADGFDNLDIGIYKTVRMPTKGHLLTIRLEGFNVLNTHQYGFPVVDIANQNFGRLLGSSTQYIPRTVQLALRYRF